jgi:hypothetical protein
VQAVVRPGMDEVPLELWASLADDEIQNFHLGVVVHHQEVGRGLRKSPAAWS